MHHLAWIPLLVLLALVYAFAIRLIVRTPFRALGVLVAGAAVHNFIVMILLRLGAPGAVVRLVQAWKEGILLLLFLMAVGLAWSAWRANRRPVLKAPDLAMVAFTVVVLVYFVLPPTLFGTHISLSQRVLGARVLLQLPLLYLLGRVFFSTRRADLVWNLTVIAGSAGVVGLVGFFELWYLPTHAWLSLGVNQFSAWLGFTYHGPLGLPENFFQTAAQGYYLRRMVSTYVSPLPIAYTGMLVLPAAIGLYLTRPVSNRMVMLRVGFICFLVIGVLLSVTRLAMVLLVGEFFLLWIAFFRRWLVWATAAAALLVVAVLVGYVRIGPVVDAQLHTPAHRPHGLRIVSSGDPSLREHGATLAYDIQYSIQHPLGTGVGTSIHRFGTTTGTGESAYFDVFGETGVFGGIAFSVAYALILLYALRAFMRNRTDPPLAAFSLVSLIGGLALVPIILTSDVWSDPSLTYLLWWCAGFTVSLAGISQRVIASGHSRIEQALG